MFSILLLIGGKSYNQLSNRVHVGVLKEVNDAQKVFDLLRVITRDSNKECQWNQWKYQPVLRLAVLVVYTKKYRIFCLPQQAENKLTCCNNLSSYFSAAMRLGMNVKIPVTCQHIGFLGIC